MSSCHKNKEVTNKQLLAISVKQKANVTEEQAGQLRRV